MKGGTAGEQRTFERGVVSPGPGSGEPGMFRGLGLEAGLAEVRGNAGKEGAGTARDHL